MHFLLSFDHFQVFFTTLTKFHDSFIILFFSISFNNFPSQKSNNNIM